MLIASVVFLFMACSNQSKVAVENRVDTLYTNTDGKGIKVVVNLEKGKAHNHPLYAIWIEDMNENYIQTLYVSKYIATGIFGHADAGNGEWKTIPGESRRPSALPYWAHKRNVLASDGTYMPTPDKPVPDAYTGATPKSSFQLITKTDNPVNGKFRLLLEVNQPWDWNNYWHTDKYPDNRNYKMSSQPSIIYVVTIDLNSNTKEYYLNPAGHGSFDGSNGLLYTNLSTLTSALQIASKIKVIVE